MKTLRTSSFFVLMVLVGTTSCCAQTADEVVGKYLQAIGGKDVVTATKSVIVSENLSVNSMDAPTTTTILAGKGYKMVADFGGTQVVQCVTDHSGWGINPMAGQSSATAMTDEEMKNAQTRLFIVPLANYASNGGKIDLVGKDTADYQVKYTNNLGFKGTYFINMKTYLLDKALVTAPSRGQMVDVTINFSDYRKADNGLMIPWKIEQVLPTITIDITVNKVDVNKDIDPKIFEMPK